jgi:AraC family transcriptional activator of tynA and feaB
VGERADGDGGIGQRIRREWLDMNGEGQKAVEVNGAFSVDFTISGATPRATIRGGAPQGSEAFLREWEREISDGRQPATDPAEADEFQVKSRALKLHDVAVIDLHGVSAVRSDGVPLKLEQQVRMFVVRRGAWTRDGSRNRGDQTLSTGEFVFENTERKSRYETVPDTTAKLFILPAAILHPLLGNRITIGSAASAEMRLLVAYSDMLHETVADLNVAGVEATRNGLLELAKAVAVGAFDDMEPRLLPALTEAAKRLADRHLADPELSPTMLARELHVSVRTLQRAFAAAGESITSYIRHRRLDEARLALTAQSRRPSISELAAYWHFADASHFVRAFKKRYNQTPAEYARSAGTISD